jgi:hypothetical protein
MSERVASSSDDIKWRPLIHAPVREMRAHWEFAVELVEVKLDFRKPSKVWFAKRDVREVDGQWQVNAKALQPLQKVFTESLDELLPPGLYFIEQLIDEESSPSFRTGPKLDMEGRRQLTDAFIDYMQYRKAQYLKRHPEKAS